MKRKSDEVEAEKTIRWHWRKGNKEAVIRWMREEDSVRIKKKPKKTGWF